LGDLGMHQVGSVLLKVLAGIAAVAILGIAGVVANGFLWGCGNNVLLEVPSPDGQHKAAIFIRNCGATTSLSTQVSVLQVPSTIGSWHIGNTFIAEARDAPIGLGGGPEVKASWVDGGILELQYPAKAKVFRSETSVNSVTVRYATFE
jgi:hypothetical protein